MFDFPMEEASVWTSLYCLFVFLVILWINYYDAIKYPFVKRVSLKKKKWVYIFIAFFFITHCMHGDFFHFMESIRNYTYISGYHHYGEEIYQIIAKFVDKNYFLFRTIVWGGSFVLFCWTSRRFNVPVYYVAVFLFATQSITFAYARATAAMAVYFFGFSFLCKPLKKSKWLGYIVSILIIYLSWSFHNSALIMLIMTAIIMLPLRKWNIIAIVCVMPVFCFLLKDYLFIFAEETSNEILSKKINTYTERELKNGIAAQIMNLFEYLSFYVPFIISSLQIFKKQIYPKVPLDIKNIYKVFFGLILVSSTFYLLGDTYVTFFYRILYMTMIPLSIIVVKLYQCGFMSRKQFYYCVIPGIINLILRYLYGIYLNSLDL